MRFSLYTNLKPYLLLFLISALPLLGHSQAKIEVTVGGAVVTDGNQEQPDASAVLDVSSGSKGVLFPRLNTATRDLIPSPAEGLLIYNTDKKLYEFYNGTEWLEMGISSGSGGSGSYDADAQLVFDRMPTLTNAEKTAINTFIVAEKSAGNYAKYDEFFLFPLGATNGLIGFKSKTASAHGGVTWGTDGASFDGVDDYIDTNFNPSSDGSQYVLNDGLVGAFIVNGDNTGNRYPFGIFENNDNKIELFTNSGKLRASLNSRTYDAKLSTLFSPKTLYVVGRYSNLQSGLHINGVDQGVQTMASQNIPNLNMHIGAVNSSGSAGAFSNTTIATYITGSAVGFDHVAHNTNVRQLLTDLGMSLTSYDPDAQLVFDRMPTLTESQKTAINTFIVAEKAAGNYAKYDEFFLFPLGATNGLIGFKSKTATAHGGVTWSTDGATFDGVDDYIDSNFNPGVDGVNFTLTNAMVGHFVKSVTVQNNKFSLGVSDGTSQISLGKGGFPISASLNAASGNNLGGIGYAPNRQISIFRRSTENNFVDVAYDGITTLGDNNIKTQVPGANVYIGAFNNNGSATSHWTGTLASAIIGEGISFDHAAHNTNVRQLLADLGVDLTPPIDADVQAVYDRMPTLTESQKTAINTFIVAEKAAGNYAKYDEFFLFPLGATNGLIGFKSKMATAHGGVTWGTDGATFDGVDDYIDTNFTPSVDGVNFQLNNATVSLFVKQTNSANTSQALMGVNYPNGNRLDLLQENATTFYYSANSGASNLTRTFRNNSLETISRTSSSLSTVYRDGASLATSTANSTNLPGHDIYIGAYAWVGSTAVSFFDGTVSTFAIGAGVGFDHTTHNTNVRQLLTDLGLDLTTSSYDPDVQAVFDRMPTLTESQKTAINNFIVAEKAAGNYAKYDEFFLFPLGATNGLIGFKSKTATAHGGVTWSVDGATFDGTDDYINTNFNLSTDGQNYQLNDAQLNVFVKNIVVPNDPEVNVLFGANISSNITDFVFNNVIGQRMRINAAVSGYVDLTGNQLTNNTLITMRRTASNAMNILNDGVALGVDHNRASTAIPNGNLFVGASNSNSTASYFINGTMSTVLVGAGVGFDHAAHNTNVRQLLTDLGLTL